MKSYEPDSTIDAAVLCEYGVFNTNTYDFTRTIRYKIFSKEGLDHLIMSIPVDSKGAVRGAVFNYEDGEIVSSKLVRSSIYRERVVGDYYRMRIAPPDAREGSVVDIKYTIPLLPRSWQFQKKIPVLWSELVIPNNPYISFNKRFVGHIPLSEVTNNRWVAKNMPPFLSEPYISSSNNFMTTMFLEISGISIPPGNYSKGIYENYSKNWKDVASIYGSDEDFGSILVTSAGYLSSAAESIKFGSTTEQELVEKALNHIRESVKWNKEKHLYPSPSLRNVYLNEKTGTSADMNFLFLKLLEKLDVECHPMLISLRDEGVVNRYYPSHSRFNYVISYVKIGEEYYAIDAADKYYPYDMLNPDCINEAGFVIRMKERTYNWVDIESEKTSRRMINALLKLEQDGLLTGSMTIQHAGYSSAAFRKYQEKFTTQDEYLEEFETEQPGTFVMDYSVENLDQDLGTVKETISLEIEGKANVAGGLIYLNPVVFGQITENPFKLEKREYPVDYIYNWNKTYLMSLTIPEGYVVEQLPEPVKLVTEEESIIYLLNATQTLTTIQVMIRFSILKPRFTQAEYGELRALYDFVVNKESEPIILKKVIP